MTQMPMVPMPDGYRFQETHAVHICECRDCLMYRHIAAAIRAAVAERQELDAKIADAEAEGARQHPAQPFMNGQLFAAECIANRIRTGATPECEHDRKNDHGDACLDCGAVYIIGEGWK
jgi:hypothetical protein